MALDAELREILQRMETDLKLTIQLDTLLPILCKKHLVTQAERQRLSSDKDSDVEKNGKFVRIIQGKGENTFDLFIEALKEEKEHLGHGSLAQKLSRERALISKARDTLSEEKPNCKESRDLDRPEPLPRATRKKGPPPPPPKPQTQNLQKEVDGTKYFLSVQDDNPLQRVSFLMSDMNDQMQKLTSRIVLVENDIKQMKEAVLNKSLQFAVEDIQNTLSGLVCTLKEADYMRTETIMPSYHSIPVTSPSQDDGGIYITAVDNHYIETDQCYVTVAGPAIKETERSTKMVENEECVYDTVCNTGSPQGYMTLEATGERNRPNEYHYIKPVKQNRFKQGDYVEEQKLASGKNGEIWLAVNKKSGSKVVIKKVRSKEVFTQEASALMHISHPNVIRLIDSFVNSSPSLIFEYAENGDLWNCLRSKSNTFSISQLLAMGANVANGMVQLAHRGIIHCDLKARSVLIDSHFMCKIGAFNKARCLQPGESSYTPPHGVTMSLPIKWLAPELLQKRKFSIKSDVWAFAVLLSEVFSQGGIPYPNMDNAQVKDSVQRGDIMVRPKGCPSEVFEVMKACFKSHAKSRPSFSTLYQQLKDLHSKSSREATSSGSECEEI